MHQVTINVFQFQCCIQIYNIYSLLTLMVVSNRDLYFFFFFNPKPHVNFTDMLQNFADNFSLNRNIIMYYLYGLIICHMKILLLTNFSLLDLYAIRKHLKIQKASIPTFLNEIDRGLGILCGLYTKKSTKVNIVYIFTINPDFNENDKEMSYLTNI